MKAVKDKTEPIQPETTETEQEQGTKEAGVFVGREGGLIILEMRSPQGAMGFKLTAEQAYSVAKFLQVHADEASASVEVIEPIETVEAD